MGQMGVGAACVWMDGMRKAWCACVPVLTMLNVRACCDDIVQHRRALGAQERSGMLKATACQHTQPRDGANA